jgi:hypothetical protein
MRKLWGSQGLDLPGFPERSKMKTAIDGQTWGNWTYDKERLVLAYNLSRIGWWYEIDLERCCTSAQVLDWIFQVSIKGPISVQDVHDMIEALRFIVNPQATLCSGGVERRNFKVSA